MDGPHHGKRQTLAKAAPPDVSEADGSLCAKSGPRFTAKVERRASPTAQHHTRHMAPWCPEAHGVLS